MKNIAVFILLQFLPIAFMGQITVISTGTPSPDRVHISVIDSKIVISGDYNFIQRSNDECNTFTPLTVPEPGNSNILTRVDTSVSYMLSGPLFTKSIYKSINGGLNWAQTYTTNLDLDHLAFFDKNDIIGVCGGYQLIKTTNGGNTWTISSGPAYAPTTVKVYGDSIIAIGDANNGNIFISKDKGNTWSSNMGVAGAATSVCFLNKDTVFAIGIEGTFARSYNGGLTSQNGSLPIWNCYYVYFKNKNEGYVLGEDNGDIIFKTTDLGQTWSAFYPGTTGGLIDLEFLNDSIALVSGYNGHLFKWNTKQTIFVGVKEISTTNNTTINIYPNPIDDILNIDVDILKGDKTKLQILNNLGQTVKEEKIKNPKSQIDLSQLPSGVYTLKVFIEHEYKTFKIIKN